MICYVLRRRSHVLHLKVAVLSRLCILTDPQRSDGRLWIMV
jgi:hypothetical protein